MTEDLKTRARLVPKGNRYEDFEPGRVFKHHWGRTITEAESTLFSTLTLHFNPHYFNAAYARAHGHPGIVVNPLLVFTTVFGLTVEDLSEGGGPFLGVNELAELFAALRDGQAKKPVALALPRFKAEFKADLTAPLRQAGIQKAFEEARPAFEAAVKEAPESAERHAALGWLYALMGRKNDAIREGRRAVELKPESKDAVDGSLLSGYLALIYARVGENDLAIPLIERLLKTFGAVDSANYAITVNDLKHRWEWDPIRDDPRFQKLVAKNAP